jgi:hypothetical protein
MKEKMSGRRLLITKINSLRLTTYQFIKQNFDHPLISMLANQEKKVRLFVLTRHEIKGRAIAIHADIHIGSIEQT